jgi:secondary thiamine-phosphate synthase enzyme
MQEFDVETTQRLSVVDVTDRVERALPADAGGTATVFVRHTTAAVTVNEAERRLRGDFETALADIVPDAGWDHDALEGNADAHVRAMLVVGRGHQSTRTVRRADSTASGGVGGTAPALTPRLCGRSRKRGAKPTFITSPVEP